MKHETALAHAAPEPSAGYPFAGTWVNELGSTMTLTADSDGLLAGTYTSGVGTDNTASTPNADAATASATSAAAPTGTVTGWVSGTLIAFTVQWNGLAAITAWAGQLVIEDQTPTIATLWHLTNAIPDPTNPDELWESVLAGADNFTRTA